MKKKDAMAAKPLAISALVLGQQAALEREIGTVVWALDDRLETTVPDLQHLDAIRAEEQEHIFHDVSHQVFRLYADRSDQRTIKLADDIIQRVRDRNLGELTDTWNENCATHPELRTYNPYKLLRRFEDAVKPPEAKPPAVPPAPIGHYQPPGSRSFPIDLGELRQVVGQGISSVVRRRSNGDNALSTIENIFDVVEQRVKLRQRDLSDDMMAEWSREIENPGSTRRRSPKGRGGDQRRSSSSVSLAEARSTPPPPSGYRELDNGEGSSRGQRTQIPPPPNWNQDPWLGYANGRSGVSEREQFRAAELSSVSTRRRPVNSPSNPNDPFVPRAGNTFPQYNHNGGVNGVNRLGELLHVQANLDGSEEGSWRHGDDIWRLKVPWR
ncbi:hypothetical protein GE09DRAFT_1231647 [Coniochaeta sp. 2T2.1]|nr:hypothetical protein GE09DRAFT_1231647 [Coniochaeta sp. 2T2.1]